MPHRWGVATPSDPDRKWSGFIYADEYIGNSLRPMFVQQAADIYMFVDTERLIAYTFLGWPNGGIAIWIRDDLIHVP